MSAPGDVPIEDRLAFFACLLHVATRHGLSPDEAAFIRQLSYALGLDDRDSGALQDLVVSTGDLDRALDRVKDTRTARLLLQQVVVLGWADGQYDADERAAVRAIAARFGLDTAWVARIEAWAHEGLAWQARGRAMVEE